MNLNAIFASFEQKLVKYTSFFFFQVAANLVFPLDPSLSLNYFLIRSVMFQLKPKRTPHMWTAGVLSDSFPLLAGGMPLNEKNQPGEWISGSVS